MLNSKRILAIGAHPDDVEYGCLGLLLKLNSESEKHIFVASLGSAGDSTTGPQRKIESENCLSVLNPKSITFNESAGISMNDYEQLSSILYSQIEKIKPDLILTMGPHDTHQEHRLVYDLTITAARRSRASILSYGILSNTPQFSPTFFVNIEDVYQQKIKSLKEHKSQSQKYYMTQDYLEIFHSHNYAALHGVRYAEVYEVVQIFT